MKKKEVDIIETNIMFAVDIKVNVKVRKTTLYGNSEPKYILAEVAGVGVFELDLSTKDDIIRNIQREAFAAVKEHEDSIRKDMSDAKR